jgi:hypothetical protein
MQDKELFRFENKIGISTFLPALEHILTECREPKPPYTQQNKFSEIDPDLVIRAKILFTKVSLADDSILQYLDDYSDYTRNTNRVIVNTFNAFSDAAPNLSELEKFIPHSLNLLLIFIAFLSKEITYKHYSKRTDKPTDAALPLKEILVEMDAYLNAFASSKQTVNDKNKVKYYTGQIQSHKEQETLRKLDEAVIAAEQARNDVIKEIDEAKKIIPVKISETLEANAKTLGKKFILLLRWKQIERGATLLILISMGILIVWLAAEIARPSSIPGPLAFAAKSLEQAFDIKSPNISSTDTTVANKNISAENTLSKDTTQYSDIIVTVANNPGGIPGNTGAIQNSLHPIWDNLYFRIITPIALEILLIYFFRIILRGYNKITTEITQLQNRWILTNFLPAYAEYAKNNKNNPVLEHFSNFIFKPLISDANDIPKLIDGVKVVANFDKKDNQAE